MKTRVHLREVQVTCPNPECGVHITFRVRSDEFPKRKVCHGRVGVYCATIISVGVDNGGKVSVMADGKPLAKHLWSIKWSGETS